MGGDRKITMRYWDSKVERKMNCVLHTAVRLYVRQKGRNQWDALGFVFCSKATEIYDVVHL